MKLKTVKEMTLKEKLGQLIIAGFHGYEYNDHLKTLIEEYKVGNIILFTSLIKIHYPIHIRISNCKRTKSLFFSTFH